MLLLVLVGKGAGWAMAASTHTGSKAHPNPERPRSKIGLEDRELQAEWRGRLLLSVVWAWMLVKAAALCFILNLN